MQTIHFVATVVVEPNGTDIDVIVDNLQQVFQAARESGWITSSTTAELESLASEANVVSVGTCRHCGGTHINGQGVEISGHSARQECICMDCGAVWTDIYTLTRQEEEEMTQAEAHRLNLVRSAREAIAAQKRIIEHDGPLEAHKLSLRSLESQFDSLKSSNRS